MTKQEASGEGPPAAEQQPPSRWTMRPIQMAREAAEDIPLLPSRDHITVVSLAALVGLMAGLAATLLRVSVRLVSALMLTPDRVGTLIFDRSSVIRADFRSGMLGIETDIVVLGASLGVVLVAYGLYRDANRHRTGHLRRSRAHLVAALLAGGAASHWLLQVLTSAADALTPGHDGLLHMFEQTPWWGLCLVALVGGLIVGILAHYFEAARGHGVPDVMSAVALQGGKMPTRTGPIFAGAACVTVASTGSVGLEGPVVVFGAATASGLGRALLLTPERLRVLVAAGAAAGIAASFNAPIAGALFALEIVVGDFALTMFSPVMIASVVGTVVHRSIQGNHPIFAEAAFQINSGYEILLYVLLGFLCGGVGSIFVRVMEWLRRRAGQALAPIPDFLRPSAGLILLVLLAVGLQRYEILGSGYDTMADLMSGRLVGPTVVLILTAKMVATALTLGAGGIGGIFLPSLMLGASTGSLFGSLAGTALGDRIASPGSFALVGMGAVLTAVQHAPLTAVVMVFELSNNESVIVPLLVACILSTLVATRALGMNIYQRVLERAGTVLSRGKEQNLLRALKVRDAMRHRVITIHVSTPLNALEQIVSNSQQTTYPMVDGEGLLAGVISLADLRVVMFEHEGLDDLVVAGELGHPVAAIIHPEDTLATALEHLSGQPFEHLVVVESDHERKVVGLLSHQGVMAAYRKALQREGLFERSSRVEV